MPVLRVFFLALAAAAAAAAQPPSTPPSFDVSGAFTYVVDVTMMDEPFRVEAYGSVVQNASRVVTSNFHGNQEQIIRNGFNGSNWMFFVLNRGKPGERCWAIESRDTPIPLVRFTYNLAMYGPKLAWLGQEKLGSNVVDRWSFATEHESESGWYLQSIRRSYFFETGGERRLLRARQMDGGGSGSEVEFVSLAREEPSPNMAIFDVPTSCQAPLQSTSSLARGLKARPFSGEAWDFWMEQRLMQTAIIGTSLESFQMYTSTAQRASAPPTSWDSRDYGWVTPVRDQGNCGSCWSFGTTAAMEIILAKATGDTNPQHLSPQSLLDCAASTSASGPIAPMQPSKQCMGCFGCDPSRAVDFLVQANWSLPLENDYKYYGTDGTCGPEAFGKRRHIQPYEVQPFNESAMESAVVEHGAVIVVIDVPKTLGSYSEGIYDDEKLCDPHMPSHTVTIVGYGVETRPDGSSKKYWTIKNSWSKGWGEQGYVRIEKGVNLCGVESQKIITMGVR